MAFGRTGARTGRPQLARWPHTRGVLRDLSRTSMCWPGLAGRCDGRTRRLRLWVRPNAHGGRSGRRTRPRRLLCWRQSRLPVAGGNAPGMRPGQPEVWGTPLTRTWPSGSSRRPSSRPPSATAQARARARAQAARPRREAMPAGSAAATLAEGPRPRAPAAGGQALPGPIGHTTRARAPPPVGHGAVCRSAEPRRDPGAGAAGAGRPPRLRSGRQTCRPSARGRLGRRRVAAPQARTQARRDALQAALCPPGGYRTLLGRRRR